MRTREDSWKPRGTWGACDRCGFAYRLTELRTEWTGLKVCTDGCYDPRPYDLDPPQYVPEGLPIPGARPDLAANPDLGVTAQDAFYAQIGYKPPYSPVPAENGALPTDIVTDENGEPVTVNGDYVTED